MLLVVADTSPIRYLVQIGHIDLLHDLFDTVHVPVEVARELSDPSAPRPVQEWINAPPDWLVVSNASGSGHPALAALDPGEKAAITLGLELKADLILIDERKGAAAASVVGLQTTGTLGVLDLAARRNFIDLAKSIDELKATNFRYRQSMIDALLDELKR